MEVLEKRVLYSADPVFAPLLDALLHPPEPALEEQYLLTLAAPSSEPFTSELVIVDVSTTDLHELYLSLQEQYEGSTTQVVALEAVEDPFAQLSRLLEHYSELDAIHLLSFGSDGQMQLGGESIGSNELLANSAVVEKWGDSLTDSGDLLLYGCNLSATQTGQQLAQTFSTLMQADVASSDDITGHTDLGGDWELEIEFGQLQTSQLLDQATQDSWVSKLDITSGLIGHYELEINGSNSAGVAYAVEVNNPDFLSGAIGIAVSLNDEPFSADNNQYLVVDAVNSPKYAGGDFTAAFWMNPYLIGEATLIDQSDGVAGYTVKLLSTGQIQVEVPQPIGSPLILNSSFVVTSNEWSHVTVTHSASQWTLYFGEFEDSTFVASSTFSDANEKLYIGENHLLNSRFSGALDDIRFYDRALSQLDAQELTALGGGTTPTPNTEERLPTNIGLSLENGQQLQVSYHELRAADDEQGPTDLTFTIDALVPDFTVFLNGVVLGVNDTFTQQDIFNNLVSIAHDGIDASSGLLGLTLDDGFGTSTTFTFSLAAATNLAPTDIVLVDAENDIGLELNVTGGDAAYFGINDAPTLFGGLDTLTYEVTLETATVNPASSTLVSYVATGDSTPYFKVSLDQSVGVEIQIGNNIWVVSTAAAQSMMDGTKHSLAFTWDSATGDANLFIDGELTESITFAQGLVLDSTGVGAVGNDVVASSFASFSGVLHDMRLFDYVRPQAQIVAEQDAEYGLNEPGLVGHWTFDSRTASGQIGSEVGKHYLSPLQSTHTGATTGAASLANATVDENSANGTIVGKVQGIDPERDALISQILANTSKIYYSESAGIFLVVGDGRPNWNDAYTAAANMMLNGVNGHLAMPNNAVEDTLLINAMNDLSLGLTWISATDEANEGIWMIRKPGELDVQFADANGNSVNGAYINWPGDEPNDAFGGEHYGEISHVSGQWNDVNGAKGNYFLAEFDVEDVLNGAPGPANVERDLKYSITLQSVGGTFAIDAVTGQIIVANGTNLDFENIPSHIVIVEVEDNAGNRVQREFTIEVNELDEVSVHSTPGVQSVPEDGSTTLSGVNGNAIQIADPDDAENLTMTLQSFSGSVSLSQTIGLTVLSADDTHVIVSGSVAELNLALDGLVYSPVANFDGIGAITIETVRSSDYGYFSALKTNSQVVFSVIPAPDSPVAVADFLEVAEAGSVTSVVGGAVSLLANDTDVDAGAVLTIDSFTPTANGLVVIDGSGTFTYTHDGSETTTDSFQYTVKDETGLTSTATVSISITPVNDAPTVVNDTIYVDEGGTVGPWGSTSPNTLLANDSDPESQPLAVTAFVGSAYATALIVDASGDYTYTHDGSENFSDSFTYYVSDGGPDVTIGTVTVIIAPINDIPIANPDALDVIEGGTSSLLVNATTSVLLNDTDEESGTNLAATVASQPTNGVVTLLADGAFSYTHDGSQTLSDSFTYTVTDPDGALSLPTAVSINVIPVNNVPVATNDTETVVESGLISIGVLLNDTDAENDSLTVQLVQEPINGLAIINADNTISYVHDGSETTVDSFVYSIDDGNGGTDTATVNISITQVNDVPVAVADSVVLNEGDNAVVNVLQNDTDSENDTLTPTVVSMPVNGTVVLNADNSYTYTHNGGETVTDSFTYFVTDQHGAESTQANVAISITPVNDAPVAVSDSVSVAESGTVVILVLANDNDEDQDALTVQIISTPLNGTLTLSSDNGISYVHDGSDTISDSFNYFISDGNGGNDTSTVTIAITSVNDVPIAVDDTATVSEGGSVLIVGLLNDTDSESGVLIPTLLGMPTNGLVTVDSNGGFNYVHNGSETLTDSFTYTVTDTDGAISPAATVTVTVLPVNDAPVALNDNVTVLESGTVVIPALVNDSDGDMDNLSVQINSGPTNGSAIVNADQSISYTHNGSETVTDLITYSVADGAGGTAVATVQISILSVNDTPITVADAAVVLEGDSANVEVLLNDTDAEVGLLSPAVVSAPFNGTATLNADGSFTYVHNGSESITDSFSYKVTDVDGAVSASALVSITVIPVNDAPVASDDALSLFEGTTQTVDVLVNDTDAEGGALQPVVSTAPLHGSVTVNSDNSFGYEHDGSENFSDQFNYTVFDSGGAASTATVHVNVVPVNDRSPVFTAETAGYQVFENAPINTIIGNVDVLDGDVGDVVTLALTDNAGGRFQLTPANELTVLNGALLNREIDSEHVVVVTATDLAGNMVQKSIQIDLLDEVESISALNASALFQVTEIAQNGTSLGFVSAVPTDDSGQVSYSLSDSADGRFSIDSLTGEIQVADASLLNYETDVVHQITVEALDATGASIGKQYAIKVVDINEQPLFSSAVQSITIVEDIVAGESLLTLAAADPDGDDLLYAIESGDYSGAFVIDSLTGEISIDRAELIDYETQMLHSLSVSVTDADGLSDLLQVVVSVTNVDEPFEFNNSASHVEFIENDEPVLVAPLAIISDIDSNDLTSVEISIANYHEQEDRLLVSALNKIVSQFDVLAGKLTLTGPATVEEFNSALQQVQYVNLSEHPNTDVRQLNVAIADASHSVSSSLNGVRVISVNDPLTGLPIISGDGVVGGLLSADVAAMVDLDNIAQYHYQWMRDGQVILGERGITYTPVDADAGSNLSLWVSVVDSTDRLEPWMKSASTFIPVPEVEPTPEPIPEPVLAAAQTLVIPTEPEPVVIEFEPIEAASMVNVLSSTDFVEQMLSTALRADDLTNAVNPSDPLGVMSSKAETDQVLGGDNFDQSVIVLPDVVAAMSADALRQVINPLVTNDIITVSRDIKLDAAAHEQQLASILSLDPLSLEVEEGRRVVWQVENVGMANSLTEISKNLKQAAADAKVSGSASEVLVGASLSVTAGFLIWMLRGGALLASVFSVSPLWKQLDPLPIVSASSKGGGGGDGKSIDENIETLFDQKG